eukprot:1138174-Pelagomonas_calceolata.AAC.2
MNMRQQALKVRLVPCFGIGISKFVSSVHVGFESILESGEIGVLGSRWGTCRCACSMLSFFFLGEPKDMCTWISARTCTGDPSVCHAIVGVIGLSVYNSTTTSATLHSSVSTLPVLVLVLGLRGG